jgi:hypothetical protein
LNVPATARVPIFQPTGECRPIIRWNYFLSFSVGLRCGSVGRTFPLFRFVLGFAQVFERRAEVREITHLGSTNFSQRIVVGWHGSCQWRCENR